MQEKKSNPANLHETNKVSDEKLKFTYPPDEDVYEKMKKESEIDPNDTSKLKTHNPNANDWNEKDFGEDMTGDDLDIPGAELDDAQEKIGSEDEENNYYSIGGDNHNDLEEDNG